MGAPFSLGTPRESAVSRLARAGAMAVFTAVALGAFGAHGLEKSISPARMQTFQTGVDYHFIHGLGLFVVAWTASHRNNEWIDRAWKSMAGGIALFSGSLYALVLSDLGFFAWITPFGGLLFLWSWVCVHFAWRSVPPKPKGE